jgi:hypothetical protein
MKFIIVAIWLLCGVLSCAGMNAWSQKTFDRGCGRKAHIEVLAKTMPFLLGGPISFFITMSATGFFDEGFSLSPCVRESDCSCGEEGKVR